MRKAPTTTFFWVTNVSNRNVSLTDLALSIKAYSTVNLMDTRHYSFTKDQLEKSATSGSLFLKRSKLKVRNNAPVEIKNEMLVTHNNIIPGRERSTLDIKQVDYEELKVEDTKADEEKFANENAELADLDAQPQIVKRQ